MIDDQHPGGEPFERDLRAVLDAMAPQQVPEDLGIGVADTAFGMAPVHPLHRWLPQGRRLMAAVAVLVVLVATAVAVIAMRPTAPAAAAPTPRSSLISTFVAQTDGVYGYVMLRPANWTPDGGGLPVGRGYLAPGFEGPQQGISLSVGNVKVVAGQLPPDATDAEWVLFQQAPTLAGWTAGVEAGWTRDGTAFTLLRTLPQARVYALTLPGSSIVELMALAVDQGQPLTAVLQAGGTSADLAMLEAQGVVDDFATMAGSLRALPVDPHNVVPPLATSPSPSPSAPTISMNAAEAAALRQVDSTTPVVVRSARLTTYRAENLPGNVVSGDTPVWEVRLGGTFPEPCGTPTVSPGPQGPCTNATELVLIDARDATFIQAVSPYP